MGLWPFGGGKQKAEPKEEPVKREAPQAVISAPQPSAKADGNEPEDMKSAADAAADLPLPAVFEFGGSAADAGITMKGICAADDPDQIQACLWRVDPASKDAPKEETKYQILF